MHLGVEQDRGRPAPSCAPRRWVAMISQGIRITLRSNGLATPPPRPGESSLPEPAPHAQRVEPSGLGRPTLPRPSASEGGTRTFGHLENALAMHGPWVLLVEQNVRAALRISDYGYILETGGVVGKGSAADLARDSRALWVYLGQKRHNGGHRPRRRSRFLARPGRTIASARGICDSLYCKRAKEGDMPFVASNGLTEAGTSRPSWPPA